MGRHTEGPWIVIGRKRKPKEYENGMKATIMARGHRVAIVDGPSNIDERDTWEANVMLIRSAPEMLEALEGLLSCVNVRIDDPRCAIFDKARNVVKKANGHD